MSAAFPLWDRRRLISGIAACAVLGPSVRAQTAPVDPEAVQASRRALAAAARAQVGVTTVYDPAYVRLAYPMGDVPMERGVCTDVIIRALRTVGLDLQQKVHEDMSASFAAYPQIWGLKRPDRNIDHRRAPNLETWFRRAGMSVGVSMQPADYWIGDIVTWRLTGSGLPHCGIVAAQSVSGQPLVVHNIGQGAQEEAVVFDWPQVGHYRLNVPIQTSSGRDN